MAQSDPLTTTGGNASLKAKRFDWKNDPLTISVIVILVAGGAVALAILFFDVNPTKVLAFVVLLAISAVLVVLQLRFEIVDRGVAIFFGAAIWFCLAAFVCVLALGLLRFLSEYILTSFSLPFQIVAFAAWGVLLAVTLLLIATEDNRNCLFEKLAAFGGFAPAIYSLIVLMMAVILFAAVTHLLATHDVLTLSSQPPGRQVEMGSLVGFYLWHFSEAVPLLKVNQTLRWDAPWTEYSAWVGWILLLFKLVVIVPVIGAFVGYWKGTTAPPRS
jgi:hypothetical protein